MNQVKNSNNTFIKAFYMIISLALLFGIDQITKVLAVRFLSDMSVEIIPNFLYLDLLYNKGAAFGILQNQTAFFCITTILICLILELIYFRTPSNKRFLFIKIDIILIIAGAIGNLYDRIKYGYVVDFISTIFGSYHFPTFNVADIYVTLGVIFLMFLILFYYSEDELNILISIRKKSDNENNNDSH